MVETTYTRPDIVVRLRQNATHSGDSRMIAAEEIEHLRARVAELEERQRFTYRAYCEKRDELEAAIREHGSKKC